MYFSISLKRSCNKRTCSTCSIVPPSPPNSKEIAREIDCVTRL